MPIVRRARREVGIAALPSVRKTAAATFESEGGGVELARGRLEQTRALAEAQGAEAFAGFADQGVRLGAALFGELQARERETANRTAILKASNQLSDWKNARLFNPQGGAFTLRGEAALPLPETIRAEFDKVAGEIEAGLATDEQRAAFANLRAQEWQTVDLSVRRHVFGEMQTFRAGELKSHVENATNAAIQSAADPRLVRVELEKAVSAIRTNGPSLGLGPEMIEAQVRAVTSQTHVGVISQLLATDNERGAQAYFEATRGQIEGDKLDDVMQAIDEGSVRGQSQQVADQIIREGGTLTEQRAKARAIDDPKLRDAVEQRLEHNQVIVERAEREADAAAMRAGYDILDQTPDVTKIPAHQWASYDGSTRSAMIHYANLRAAGTPIETHDPVFYGLLRMAGDTPNDFAQFNLLEVRHQLDDADFKRLADLQLSIKNGNHAAVDRDLAGFRTKQEILESTLTQYGIDPKPKAKTPEANAIAQLQRMLDRRVEAAQAEGKKVTNVEIQQVLDNLLSIPAGTKVTSFWNIWPGGQPFRVPKLAIELTIDDVPATERRRIEERLRQRNLPVTDATILDVFLEMQIS